MEYTGSIFRPLMPPVLLMWSTYAWYVACSTFGSTLMTKPMLAAPLTWNSVKPTFTGGLSLTGTVVPEPVAATVGPGLAVFVAAPEPAGVATALADKYGRFRTPRDQMPDATRAQYETTVSTIEITPDDRILSWDNARLYQPDPA